MPYTATPKLFLPDLTNYAEIRRGLTPEMRKATPTKKELKQVDAVTREKLIHQLNDWRMMSGGEKRATAHMGDGIAKVLSDAAGSNYYSASDKVKIMTAGLKLRTMDPRQAEWEIRESLNAAGRLHNQDFYKAQYYLDDDTWDPAQATNEMLQAIITGGTLQSYGENVVTATIQEYVRRIYGFASDDVDAFNWAVDQARAQMQAGYYQDILNIAKVIIGG